MVAIAEHGNVTDCSFRKGNIEGRNPRPYHRGETEKHAGRRISLCPGMPRPNLAPQEIAGESPLVHRLHAEVTFAEPTRPDRLAHASSAATIASSVDTELGVTRDRSMLRDHRVGCFKPIVNCLGAYPLARSAADNKSSDDRPPWLAEPRPYATEVFRTVEP
jgi:hypothetical protein